MCLNVCEAEELEHCEKAEHRDAAGKEGERGSWLSDCGVMSMHDLSVFDIVAIGGRQNNV